MSAAVLTAGVPALAVCVIVVAAPDIGVVAERPRQQCVHRRVRLAADAAVEPDARLCQRRLRATADTAADQDSTPCCIKKPANEPCPLPLVSTTSARTTLPSATS